MDRGDERQKLERTLLRDVGKAIADFDLVADGDRIMVAMSGGKDSYALMHALEALRGRAPIDFELVAVHLDQGQPGHDPRPLEQWLGERCIPYRFVREDTYSVVLEKVPEGKAYCSMCSRLRRGILYTTARGLGCTKIALGHHRDDVIETLLLNLFCSGQLKAMPPKLVSDDGCNVVIRPLVYCAEADLARLAASSHFPILPCNLCGSQPDLERQFVKRLLRDLEARHPSVRASMLSALTNVRPTHLLDRDLWRSLGLDVARADGEVRESLTRRRSGTVA
ncbi:MAG: tRNA 2-thiocytidine(32) synthetase TtcA [Deltaproteobacteria bacterium]|nr:tRNA 2-thiocytidine(32) synthetase TtcA [Deltaproteobacteria bacterium]